ncbi:MAG TPA: TonB-dependent receptor [Terriglobia bacterium]|nr:TonB-dependent receptor [Terriglobia bacterium]
MLKRFGILLPALLCAAYAYSQAFDTGQVSGSARDASGSVIPGVSVTIRNEAQGQERQTLTNEQGYYVFPNLPVGPYTVTGELSGFKKFVKTGIRLSAASSIRVDVELAVGNVSETIEVQASPNEVVAETAVLGRTVTEREISELIVSGRNPLMAVQFKAGVVGGSLSNYMGDGFSGGGYSINGGRPGEYLTTVDGASMNRNRQGAIINGAQGLDTVAEIQVLTANYSAEYGRASSGVVRLVTKSGTQEFHGRLVGNIQNSKLDANTWQRNASGNPRLNSVPPRKVNQFGGSLGGPIFIPGKFNTDKKKLFFFAAEEWVYRRQENTITSTVPSLAMRNGNFSELLNPANPFFGRARIITDPQTGQPFPNNVIPQNRFSANGLALFSVYPEPTPGFLEGTANYIGTRRVWSNTRKDTFRVDYMMTDKHTLALRGTNIKNNYNQPFIRHSYEWNIPSKSATLSLTSSLSPTLMNEFTVTGTIQGPQALTIDPDCGAVISDGRTGTDLCKRSTYGINYGLLFPGTKWAPEKLPTIQVQGLSTLDLGPYPGRTTDWIFTFGDNVTKVIRSHTVKLGILVEPSGQNDRIQFTTATAPSTNNQNGSFRFFDAGHPSSTGFAPANALLGYFNDYSEFGDKPVTPYKAVAWDFFAQDSWKATRKLTVEAGVRYSLWPPWHSKWGTLASFNAQYYDPARAAVIDRTGGFVVSGDRFNGMVLPGCKPTKDATDRFPFLTQFERLYHCVPDGFAPTHKDGFQPRLGLAYALNGKTAIRAGGGMFLQRNQISSSAALGGQPPLMEQQTVINGLVDSPTGAQRRDFPLTVFMQDPVFKTPTAWTWNATVERELPATTRLSVSYVGRRGYYNSRLRNISQLAPGTLQANPGVNADFLRPYKGFGVISLLENAGQSKYNGLQVSLERRRASGLGFTASYSFSRVKDDASALTTILPNAFDAKSFWGIADFDRTHSLLINTIYSFPSLTGQSQLVRWVFGNWGLVGVTQIQSGTPFSLAFASDYAGIGPGGGMQFWNQIRDPKIQRTKFTTSAVWFNKDAFAAPAAGTFGVQPRNALRNPGSWEANMSLHRNFPVTEGQRLEFRLEAFNVFNHPNPGSPGAPAVNPVNNNPTQGSFGLVTAKDGNRTMQVSLQYVF